MEFIDNITPQGIAGYYTPLKREDWKQYEPTDKDQMFETQKDFLSMYYQNAYNTAMLNYQNQYNSPLQQMLRYQEAGINPFLAANDPGNMGSAPAGAAPRASYGHYANSTQKMATAINGVSTVLQVLGLAKNMYDYLEYGRPIRAYELEEAQSAASGAASEASKKQSEADWSLYWNYGPGMGPNSPYVEGSPRAQYMAESTQRIASQIEQLRSLVDVIYPNQAEAQSAMASLNAYKQQIMEGQNGAILNIDTGNKGLDSVLRMICYWLLNQKF